MADIQATRIVIKVSTDADKASKQVNTLNRSLDNTNDELKEAEDRSGRAKKGLSGLGGAAVIAAITAAAVGVAKLSKELVLAASDAEETANKFNVVFRGLDSAGDAAENLAKSYGLSRTASQGLLADTADLLQGFGVSKDESLELSEQVQQLAVDLASFTNFSGGAEGASQALTKALLGERESVKALGIAITETELKRFAEEQGLVFEELGKAEKAFLTFDLAVQQSQNAIGDFARSQDSFANQTRIAQANIDDLKVTLGQGLLPIANLGVKAFNEIAEELQTGATAFRDFITSAEGASKIGTVIGTLAGGFAALQATLSPILESVKDGFFDVLEPLRDLIPEIAAGEAAFDVLGAAAQIVSGGFRVFSTIVREQVETVIAFANAVVGTAQLAGAAVQRLKGEITREEFQAIREETGRLWAETGREITETFTNTFGAIKDEFEGFREGVRENSMAAADAAIEARNRVSQGVTSALIQAGDSYKTELEGLSEFGEATVQDALDRYDQLAAEAGALLASQVEQVAVETGNGLKAIFDETSKAVVDTTLDIAKSFSDLFSAIDALADAQADSELQRLQVQIEQYDKGTVERLALEEEYERRSAELARENAEREKAAAIFSATINTAQAIVGALALLPSPAAIVLSALAATTGAVQIAAIASQPLPSFADGTPPLGFSPGTSDDQLIRVSSQETVQVGRNTGENEGGTQSMGGDVYLDGQLVGQMLNRMTDNNQLRPNNRALVTR